MGFDNMLAIGDLDKSSVSGAFWIGTKLERTVEQREGKKVEEPCIK